jgi:hypothetical protein
VSEYVQAWEITGSAFSGYVYDQGIAIDKWNAAGLGAELRAVTVVRHDDGSREYLPGTLAAEVKRHREGE